MSKPDSVKQESKRLVGEALGVLRALNEAAAREVRGEIVETYEKWAEAKYLYHKWYSVENVLVGSWLPERKAEFQYHHSIVSRQLVNIDPNPLDEYVSTGRPNPAENCRRMLTTQIAILESIPDVVVARALGLRELVAADFYDDEISAARQLLSKGFTRAAGVVASVALERSLKDLCGKKGLKVGKKETVGSLNQKLRESYDETANYRKVSWMAEIRATCGHDKGAEPEAGSIQELIDSVQKFVSTVS